MSQTSFSTSFSRRFVKSLAIVRDQSGRRKKIDLTSYYNGRDEVFQTILDGKQNDKKNNNTYKKVCIGLVRRYRNRYSIGKKSNYGIHLVGITFKDMI